MPDLLELQRRGIRSRILEARPRLPDHLAVVARARLDIGENSGLIGVEAWFRSAGIAPSPRRFFWLLDRLRHIEAAHNADL
jgi:hypothetical protein